MTWVQLKDEVRAQVRGIKDQRASGFIAAAWPGRVEVHRDDDGLRLVTGPAEPSGDVPREVLDKLAEVDGWAGDTSVSVPIDPDRVAELIVNVLRDAWSGSPAKWGFVGEDGYGEALAQRPRD